MVQLPQHEAPPAPPAIPRAKPRQVFGESRAIPGYLPRQTCAGIFVEFRIQLVGLANHVLVNFRNVRSRRTHLGPVLHHIVWHAPPAQCALHHKQAFVELFREPDHGKVGLQIPKRQIETLTSASAGQAPASRERFHLAIVQLGRDPFSHVIGKGKPVFVNRLVQGMKRIGPRIVIVRQNPIDGIAQNGDVLGIAGHLLVNSVVEMPEQQAIACLVRIGKFQESARFLLPLHGPETIRLSLAVFAQEHVLQRDSGCLWNVEENEHDVGGASFATRLTTCKPRTNGVAQAPKEEIASGICVFTVRILIDTLRRLIMRQHLFAAALVSAVFLMAVSAAYAVPTLETTPSLASGVPLVPRIHAPRSVGITPGRPFQMLIPATGAGRLAYEAQGLPEGLVLDTNTGIISGTIAIPPGALSKGGVYFVRPVTVTVSNEFGAARRSVSFVAGKGRIAKTPPMGWNSWNAFGVAVDGQKIRAAADWMVKSGLGACGYQYIVIDDAWAAKRGEDGVLIPNKKFGDMRLLADYVHSKGLKLGIYSSPGPRTCAGYPGSYGHEQQDAETFARWGIDYLKYDWCSYEEITSGSTKREDLMRPYRKMRAALDRVDRDIVFSICQYGMGNVWTWGREVGGNLWRTNADLEDTWESVSGVGFAQEGKQSFAGSGGWNDPDMLVVGRLGWGIDSRPTRLTPNEQVTHLSLWSLLAAPLMVGCDLSQLDQFTVDLLCNDEVLAIDQDILGKAATRRAKSGQTEVWARPLVDGTRAVGLFNRGETATTVTASFRDIEVGVREKQPVRDLWQKKDLGLFDKSFSALVPPHGTVLVKIGQPSGPTAREDEPLASSPQEWNPDEFPISFWCAPPPTSITLERYNEIAEAGFNYLMPPCNEEMTTAENRRVLDTAHEAGLKAFINDSRMPLSIGNNPQAREAIAAIVKDYGKHPALAGYHITDEPGAAAFPGLAEVVAELRRLDPGHPAYINLLPNYAPLDALGTETYEEHVDRFVREVKPAILSYDFYGMTNHGDRPGFFENLEVARKASLKYGIPFWQIILTIPHFDYRDLTEAEKRWNAMHTLAYGGKGLMYFTYWSVVLDPSWKPAMITTDGKQTHHYKDAQAINDDVAKLGKHLLRARSLAVARTTTGSAANGNIPVHIKSGDFTLGLFSGDGKKYLLAVNADYRNAQFAELQFDSEVTGLSIFKSNSETWQPVANGNVIANIPAGDAILLRW